jgi:hypothetical protein
MKGKELIRNEKSSLHKPHFVTGCHDLEVNKALFYKGFRTRKRAVLEVDDKYIVPVKNWVLTGNKNKVYNFLSL